MIADATDGCEDGSLEIQVIRDGDLDHDAPGDRERGQVLRHAVVADRRLAADRIERSDGAMWYDTDARQPLLERTTWFDALRGRLRANLDAAGFTIFGNRPHGILVPGALTLDAALHNGAVLRCSSATGQTITWNNIGDFACMVYADMPVGQSVTINGTDATNANDPGRVLRDAAPDHLERPERLGQRPANRRERVS